MTKDELDELLRHSINQKIIKLLKKGIIPWQKPWVGRGKDVGHPNNIFTKEKFFGINFILLQISAKKNGFNSSWWGTSEQFASLGMKVKNRPDSVEAGSWVTEIISYKEQICNNKVVISPCFVYNLDQTEKSNIDYILKPNYSLAEQVLHSTKAKIDYNTDGEAWYYYPPKDYITIPEKEMFERGLGGLPGYYASLAHELIHWTERKLNFFANEATCELRAEIGETMLMEELGVPNSIAYSNFKKWSPKWIELMEQDVNLIFRMAASACRAVDYLMSSNTKRFNEVSECYI